VKPKLGELIKSNEETQGSGLTQDQGKSLLNTGHSLGSPSTPIREKERSIETNKFY
jgi:hypothetical protein